MTKKQLTVFIFFLSYSIPIPIFSASILPRAFGTRLLAPANFRPLCQFNHNKKPAKVLLINTMGNSYSHTLDFTLLRHHLNKYHQLNSKHINLLSGNGLPLEGSHVMPDGDASKTSILDTIKQTSHQMAHHPKQSKKQKSQSVI